MELQRNVLNEQLLRDYAASLAAPHASAKPFVAKWLTTTFVKWLKQESPYMRQCMLERDERSPLMMIASQLFASFNFASIVSSTIKFVPASSLDSWAARALDDHNLWWFDIPAKDSAGHAAISHWIDWMCAEAPDRDLRMTVPHVIDAVAKWDRRLARQKLISELSVGVETVETQAFDGFEETTVLVLLTTRDSYLNEGAAMSHCVGTYWGRSDTKIYSLRSAGSKRPIATIEVLRTSQAWKSGRIQQVRGYANASVDQKYLDAINVWAIENQLSTLCGVDDDDREFWEENCEGVDIDDVETEKTVQAELEKEEEIERQKELEKARVQAEVNTKSMKEADEDYADWSLNTLSSRGKRKGRPPNTAR